MDDFSAVLTLVRACCVRSCQQQTGEETVPEAFHGHPDDEQLDRGQRSQPSLRLQFPWFVIENSRSLLVRADDVLLCSPAVVLTVGPERWDGELVASPQILRPDPSSSYRRAQRVLPAANCRLQIPCPQNARVLAARTRKGTFVNGC
jgi:hypothetical protein